MSVAAALVVAATLFVLGRDDMFGKPSSSALPQRERSPTITRQPPSKHPSPSIGVEVVDASLPMNNARRISEIAIRAGQNGDQRGQSLAELYDAITLCNGHAITSKRIPAPRLPGQKVPEIQLRREFQAKYFREFCDAQPYTKESAMDQLVELGPENQVVQSFALFDLEGDAVAGVGIPLAKRLASQGASPAALERAFMFLSANGEDLPAAKSVRRPASIQGREASLEAQHLAVLMVACRVRGGCGADGFVTQKWCVECMGRIGIAQQWQRQYAPDTLVYARQVADTILRSSAGD